MSTHAKYPAAQPTRVCAATGAPLAERESFIATLAEDRESEAICRLDYSLAAWEQGARPPGLIGFWRATLSRREAPPSPLVDDAALLELFAQTETQDDPRRQAFRFVVALLLVRKRLLRVEQQNATSMRVSITPAGAKLFPGVEGASDVIDPGLDEASMGEWLDQLGILMAAGSVG